ncbi:MAG: hypothetical protein PF961_18025, partial [Planctomycetota bacterium]|nr:hypothetical protein [Planctomycetota bacterium]
MAGKRVLALCASGSAMQRQVLTGVAAWLARHDVDWRMVYRELPAPEIARALRAWRGDGALAVELETWRGHWLKRLPMPTVNTLGQVEEPQLPSVLGDDHAIGRVTAEHLLERGYRRLCFVGERGSGFAARRADGVAAAVAAEGGHLVHAAVSNAIRRGGDR